MKNHPWLNEEITKTRVYNTAKVSGSVRDWKNFKYQQKMTKHKIKNVKMVSERKLSENINTHTKSFYKDIKRKRIVKVDVGPLEDGNGGVIMGNSEMAEALNQYFVSVFTVEDNNSVPKTAVNTVELGEITITREKILNKLKGLKLDKSLG